MAPQAVSYHKDSYLPVRIIDHVKLGLSPSIQDHEPNLIEKAGDAGLWVIENVPHKVCKLAQDPRVITVAGTSLALLADSYGFYPEETTAITKAAWALIPTIPWWAAKFGLYMVTAETIASLGSRAYGRFSNDELMKRFYEKEGVQREPVAIDE